MLCSSGDAAKNQFASNPRNTIFDIKLVPSQHLPDTAGITTDTDTLSDV